MLVGAQHHLSAAQYRLRGKGNGLIARQAFGNTAISQRFDEHIDIGRGASSHCAGGIHKGFFELDRQAEALKQFLDDPRLIWRDQIAHAEGGHSFAYERRGVRHDAYDLGRVPHRFAEPRKGLTGGDAHQDLAFMQVIGYFSDHALILLRLYAQEDDVGLPCNLRVIGRSLDPKKLVRFVRAFGSGVRPKYLFGSNEALCDDPLHDGACHIPAADKTESHDSSLRWPIKFFYNNASMAPCASGS